MLPQSQQLCNVFQRYLDTGYGTQVWYTATTRAAGQPDRLLSAPPGPRGHTAYATVLRQLDTEASSALTRPADKHQEELVVLVTQGTPSALPPSPSQPMRPCADSETAPPETISATEPGAAPIGTSGYTSEPTAPLPAQAVALVQQFYERFHGLPGVIPTAKELAWATTLLSQHGPARARFLLTYAREAATATNYDPQTFMGILGLQALSAVFLR